MTAAAAPSLKSSLSLVLETAFPGLRKRTKTIVSVLCLLGVAFEREITSGRNALFLAFLWLDTITLYHKDLVLKCSSLGYPD